MCDWEKSRVLGLNNIWTMLLRNLFANYICGDGISNKLVPRVHPFERILWKLHRMLSELDLFISNCFRMSAFLALLRWVQIASIWTIFEFKRIDNSGNWICIKILNLLAQLVEHCTVQAWTVFRPYFYHCRSSVHCCCEDRFQIHGMQYVCAVSGSKKRFYCNLECGWKNWYISTR